MPAGGKKKNCEITTFSPCLFATQSPRQVAPKEFFFSPFYLALLAPAISRTMKCDERKRERITWRQ